MARARIRKASPHEYFEWLCGLVQINEPDHSYFILAKTLHEFKFYSLVNMDENRINDGLKLRDFFCDECDCRLEDMPYDCSILELLIGLSYRIDGLMYGDAHGSLDVWFWELASNLGLEEFNDEQYYDLGGTKKIEKIIEKFVNRKYTKKGKGGLFPLKFSDRDQREVQIWYQMQAYLNEKYPIE